MANAGVVAPVIHDVVLSVVCLAVPWQVVVKVFQALVVAAA